MGNIVYNYIGEKNEKGERHGYGDAVFITGDTFSGIFENGRMKNGTYIWKSGDIYVGEMQMGKRNGSGKKTYINGEIIEGFWYNGEKHGLIKRTNNNNIYYSIWRYGLRIAEWKDFIPNKIVVAYCLKYSKLPSKNIKINEDEEYTCEAINLAILNQYHLDHYHDDSEHCYDHSDNYHDDTCSMDS